MMHPAALPAVDEMLARIAAHRPVRRSAGRRGFEAATALVLAGTGEVPDMLVIRRATRDGDPWSGHAALPGGKRSREDADLLDTAVRETAEEVGVALPAPIGQLDDTGGRTHLGVVSTYVFHLPARVPTVPEPAEVAAVLWVPLNIVIDPAARIRHPSRTVGPWPAWEYDGLVIWGLTHRILTSFAEVIGVA